MQGLLAVMVLPFFAAAVAIDNDVVWMVRLWDTAWSRFVRFCAVFRTWEALASLAIENACVKVRGGETIS